MTPIIIITITSLSLITIVSIIFSIYAFKWAYKHSLQSDMFQEMSNNKEEEIYKFIDFLKEDGGIKELVAMQLDHPLRKILLENLYKLEKQMGFIDDRIMAKYAKYDKILAEEYKEKIQKYNRKKTKSDGSTKFRDKVGVVEAE